MTFERNSVTSVHGGRHSRLGGCRDSLGPFVRQMTDTFLCCPIIHSRCDIHSTCLDTRHGSVGLQKEKKQRTSVTINKRNKELVSQVQGLGHVTSWSYYTLFHLFKDTHTHTPRHTHTYH